jgi:hypothetical protein
MDDTNGVSNEKIVVEEATCMPNVTDRILLI